MHSDKAETVLRRIVGLRFATLILHIVLIAIFILLAILLFHSIERKYLFSHPILSLLIISTAASILLICSLFHFRDFRIKRVLREMDQEHQLLDRLTTYYELRKTNHPFLPPFVAEMERKISDVSPVSFFLRNSGLAIPIACIALMLIGFIALPNLPVPETTARLKQERQRVRIEAKNLQKELLHLTKPKDAPTEKLFKEFERTASELQKQDVSNEEALRKLNDLQQKLEETDKNNGSTKQKEFEQSLNALDGKNPSTSEKEALQELADQIEKSRDSAEAREAAESMLNDKRLSAQTKENLKKAIERYDEQQKQSQKSMAEMQKVLENARKGISPGTHKWTANSEINERDLEKMKGGVSDGPGVTNQDLGPQSFDTKKNGSSQYVEDRTKAQYEQLYKGQREKAGSDPLFLKSQSDKHGEQKFIRIRTFGLDKKSSAGIAGDIAVTQDTDESALQQEKIPASYQKIVKKYFQSIKEQ